MMPKTFCDNVSVTQRGAAEQLPLETPHETSSLNCDDNNDNGRIFSRKCSNYHLWQWIEIDQQVDPGKCPNINIEPTVQKTFRDQSTGWLIYAEGKAIVGELKVTKLKSPIICHFSPWRPFSSIWLHGGYSGNSDDVANSHFPGLLEKPMLVNNGKACTPMSFF